MLSILIAFTLKANINLNINNSPQPGWSLWQKDTEMKKTDVEFGFSNSDASEYSSFGIACSDMGSKLGLKPEQVDYWFRVSNLTNRIGTGDLEIGCLWKNGGFYETFKTTAVNTKFKNIKCFRVYTPNRESLVIREEPNTNAKKLGIINYRRTVRLDGFPATISEVDGENWIYIISPAKGWISDGNVAASGKLRLCSSNFVK